MRIFKTKEFKKETRKTSVSDRALCSAIDRIESGSVVANLGGGLFKLRMARAGQGKSGGFRTYLAFRKGDLAVFLHCHAKNEYENISDGQNDVLKILADTYFNFADADIERAVQDGELIRVEDEKNVERP